MNYRNYVEAFLFTKDPTADRNVVDAQLKKIGFTLGSRTVDTAHKAYARWLTSHGLDINHAELYQQALINDNATVVRRYIKLCEAGKHNDAEAIMLSDQLKAAGINILDAKRLQRCLTLTAGKAKKGKKQQTNRKRRGAKYRADARAVVVDKNSSEYFERREALIQYAMDRYDYDHEKAAALIDGYITEYADPQIDYDLEAIAQVENLPEFRGGNI